MNEDALNQLVIQFCQHEVDKFKENANEELRTHMPPLVVGAYKVNAGSIPWWEGERRWKHKQFKRQIDVVIAIDADFDGKKELIPLIAVELKAGSYLNTDELDKKSAIYGPLREVYPWVHTVFIHGDNNERNMGEAYLFRNGRHFNSIFTEWDTQSQKLFKNLIHHHLEYCLDYWRL
ncbi:hypothetical protein [Vibrio jasicida]|uniref:hypothetical protein n=1 Tax=Vibrio jasicida TaxID=766224 RepID=UPI0005ED723E|nr:hypothetical protein [Vibrio jasicida]